MGLTTTLSSQRKTLWKTIARRPQRHRRSLSPSANRENSNAPCLIPKEEIFICLRHHKSQSHERKTSTISLTLSLVLFSISFPRSRVPMSRFRTAAGTTVEGAMVAGRQAPGRHLPHHGGGGQSSDGRLEAGDPPIGGSVGGRRGTGETKERLEARRWEAGDWRSGDGRSEASVPVMGGWKRGRMRGTGKTMGRRKEEEAGTRLLPGKTEVRDSVLIARAFLVHSPQEIKFVFDRFTVNGVMQVVDVQRFLTEYQGEKNATKKDAHVVIDSLREFKHLNIFQGNGISILSKARVAGSPVGCRSGNLCGGH
ncbi:hypothetical protein ACLOJK_026273 [Asimina triloba]